ncbi:uncharacterized protein LOC106651087 [Trichogramma pretiosum]|uniref:uncharacterized protein LOC106651087 n=1 Tax=Trichogramma pretiosum TaxID=7493 RepID=UPI0006C9C64F|nr:uncharacterized protein LOC106651087 [Trichogramma pretiosum]
MSSIDDSSIIAGLSNLSRISKVNNTTLYKFDSTCNTSEWRSMLTDFQKTDLKKNSDYTKINQALRSVEDSTAEYAILQMMYECLQNTIDSEASGMDNKTLNKLRDLVSIHEIKKHLHLPNNSKDHKDELSLLGIIDLPKYEFTYEEQLSIKNCLETKAKEKLDKFIQIYKSYVGTIKNLSKNNESMLCQRFQQKGELENIHWKEKIEEVCYEYQRDLLYCLELLKQWEDIKSRVNKKNTKDAENLLLQAEIAEKKAMITKLTCTIRMYLETPVTVDAFRILNNSLDDKLASVTQEIQTKNDLLKAYSALNGTEYDEILRKYLEICHVIKKKKKLLEQL